MPQGFAPFLAAVPNLTFASQEVIETAWQKIRGTLEGRHFLFAIAIKTSVRSDRLYQALFEAKARGYRTLRNLKAITYLVAGKLQLNLPT